MGSKNRSALPLTLLAASTIFAAYLEPAAASSADTPSPPPQICVNNVCATTAVSPVTPPSPTPPSPTPPGPTPPVTTPPSPSSGPHTIKWNPGHYMAGETVLYGGSTMPGLQRGMDDLNNQDAMLGMRLWVTWSQIETAKGVYDFSQIDAVLARLKTQYNKPKRLVIGLWLYGQGRLGTNGDARVFPTYIQNDPRYGQSPVAGSYGWWGKNANGQSIGMYAPALYNQPVMDRLIAVVQALGARYDKEEYVEGFYVQEDATIAEAATSWPPRSPDYSDDAWFTQLQRLLTAATAAFPHTNVIQANSWFNRPKDSVALTQWFVGNRIALGSADSWGQSSLSAVGTTNLSDGIQVYLGTDQYGGSGDLRGKMTAMLEVQSPDLVGNYFAKYSGPWTPIDLIHAFNQTYYASHVFWDHFFGNETNYQTPIPDAAKWSNLAATCAANPLMHTDYPANYP